MILEYIQLCYLRVQTNWATASLEYAEISVQIITAFLMSKWYLSHYECVQTSVWMNWLHEAYMYFLTLCYLCMNSYCHSWGIQTKETGPQMTH